MFIKGGLSKELYSCGSGWVKRRIQRRRNGERGHLNREARNRPPTSRRVTTMKEIYKPTQRERLGR